MNTADQHAAAMAIVHEEAGRTLSKDDFDLCMRIAKRALAALHSDAAQAPKLRIGTSIRFTQTLREGATGDHPAFLYAEAGEAGEITGYNDFEGYMVKTDSWPHAFGARRSEFEVVAPGAAAQGGVVPINLEGLREKLLTPREIVRDEDGWLWHPDYPVCDEGTHAGKFLDAFGIEAVFVSMESDDPEGAERYFEAGEPDCSYWTPTPPAGDGWVLLEIYDTEDGPYALFGRDAYHDWADKLADAIGLHLGVDIGEHSSANNSWNEALDAIMSTPSVAELSAAPARDGEATAWRTTEPAVCVPMTEDPSVAALWREAGHDVIELFEHISHPTGKAEDAQASLADEARWRYLASHAVIVDASVEGMISITVAKDADAGALEVAAERAIDILAAQPESGADHD
jgi:hypothetical protein